MRGSWDRMAPVLGVLAIVLIAVSFIVAGETPSADDSAAETAAFYTENDSEVMLASILLAFGGALLALFLASLIGRLRRAGQADALAAGSAIGTALLATGILIFAGIGFTLGDVADDLDPSAVQALNALNQDLFFPLAGGVVVLSWSLALSLLRTGGLPRWLGWTALVIGVFALTPAGFFAMLALLLWILIVSVTMLLRPEDAPAAAR